MNSNITNKASTITLEGHLEHITYHNKENNYTVARLSLGQTHNPVTIIGHMAGISPGQSLKIEGHWQTHPKYGQQFKVQSYDVTIPATVDGIRKYLESGAIKGIGPSMADRLVNAFGAETFEVIEKNPERLTEIEGILLNYVKDDEKWAAKYRQWQEAGVAPQVVFEVHVRDVQPPTRSWGVYRAELLGGVYPHQ